MTVIQTYLARKIVLRKDVHHTQASVVVRIFSTQLHQLSPYHSIHERFHSQETLLPKPETCKRGRKKTPNHQNLICLQNLQKSGQKNMGLPLIKCWKMFSLCLLCSPAISLQTFSPCSMWKIQGQPLKWKSLNSGLVSTNAVDQRTI